MLERLKTDRRFGLYIAALALLALLCGVAVWSVGRTGAWLTDEGDWQYLGGDYRIGTIDYVVEINDRLLMELDPKTADSVTYQLAVPLVGGVRMFDPTVDTDALRTAEFNEGATLAKVRVINRSDSMVEVHASFALDTGTTGAALRLLPLPVTLDAAGAERLDYRQYVKDTLGMTADLANYNDGADGTAEEQALAVLETAYTAYQTANSPYQMDAGIIPGVIGADPSQSNVVELDGECYYYKDVYVLLWSEYGTREYNDEKGSGAPVRQGRLNAVFTVGQLE